MGTEQCGLIACIIEDFNDEYGIQWPLPVAPCQVHLLCLALTDQRRMEQGRGSLSELSEAGLEILYDDRQARASIKFNDADLVGISL